MKIESLVQDNKRNGDDRRESLPQLVWAQCRGYRCLAFRDVNGKWVNFYTGTRVNDFVEVIN